MRITKKKIAGAVAVSAVVALGAGTAFAYWTSTGTGSGTAGVGTDTAVSIATDAVTGLYPGSTLDLNLTVQNTNPYAVFLASGIGGTVSVDSAHSTCGIDNFQITAPTAGINIPAQVAATTGNPDPAEYTNGTAYKITMLAKADTTVAANNQNACKGATVTIAWKAL